MEETIKNLAVLKFGGSSLSDLTKIERASQIVSDYHKNNFQILVVVSAMGKLTDELVNLGKKLSANPNPREMDMLLTVGERVSMSLFSIALDKLGIKSASLTGSQAGIITNARQGDAKIIDVRPYRILDLLNEGNVVIVAGYQGQSYQNEITTLGRGGSDTTAVALAASLGAKYCDIYSDVAGVFESDPNKITKAKLINELSYEKIENAALQGARVLNPEAVRWAKKNKIPLRLFKTETGEMGSIISEKAPGENPIYTLHEEIFMSNVKDSSQKALAVINDKATSKTRYFYQKTVTNSEKVDLIFTSGSRIESLAPEVIEYLWFSETGLIICENKKGKELIEKILVQDN